MGKFFGTYNRNLDSKNRLQIPSKLVKEIPDKFYLLRGFEGTLAIYEEKEFNEFLSKLEAMSYMEPKARTYLRLSLSSVDILEVDSHGRITLSAAVTSMYKISNEVTIIGVLDHFEIWDRKTYEEYQKNNVSSYEKIAEDLASMATKGA